MKAGSSGDWHVTSGPRLADTLGVLEWVAADGAEQGVDLWLIGGDLAGTHDVPHVADVWERRGIVATVRKGADQAPVVILYGNHDMAADLEVYGHLAGAHPIHVVTEPSILTVAGAQVVCVPYPRRGYWLERAGEGTVTDQNAAASDALYAWLVEACREARRRGGPVIVFAHCNVIGSKVGGDEILSGHEVELSVDQLDALPADYIALSHIHRHQRLGRRAWFPGSPTAQTFGETEIKGYIVANIEPGVPPIVDFRPTPTRRMVTVDARWDGEQFAVAEAEIPAGAEVKVRLAIPEQYIGTCPTAQLEGRFGGAHSVVVDPTVVPLQRVRSEAIQHARTNEERLAAWWESLGDAAPDAATRDRMLAKLADIEAELAAGTDTSTAAEAA